LFDYQPGLWSASSYFVRSPVSLAVFREFVAGLEPHGDIQPTHENAASFSLLAKEFGIRSFLGAFHESQPESISALTERLFNLETRIASFSEPNQKRYFRSLGEQFLILEKHVETFLPRPRWVEVEFDDHLATNERELCLVASRAADFESLIHREVNCIPSDGQRSLNDSVARSLPRNDPKLGQINSQIARLKFTSRDVQNSLNDQIRAESTKPHRIQDEINTIKSKFDEFNSRIQPNAENLFGLPHGRHRIQNLSELSDTAFQIECQFPVCQSP
jgi:hypothetical protein